MSTADEETLSRSEQVVQWRESDSLTFPQIARKLGVSKQRAIQLYYEEIDRPYRTANCPCGEPLINGSGRPGHPRTYCSKTCYYRFVQTRKDDTSVLTRHQRAVHYKRLIIEQGDLCAICEQPESAVTVHGKPKSLAVDHCHTTGTVRALLCTRCNTMLGGAKDDPETLRRAADYLEFHAATQEPA